MSAPHIWFCRDCKRKGDMHAKDTYDILLATQQHEVSSPNCKGQLRTASEVEAGLDPSIDTYQDWTD